MPSKLPPFWKRLRFATSLISTWLLNLNMFGFSLKSICSPGFNCHGCAWATAACPIGAMAFGSAMHAVPVMAIASVLAVGAVAGRLVCSFVCPFGLLQDLLHKIPGPKLRMPKWLKYGKYVVLALLVFILPYLLGFDVAGYLFLEKPAVNRNSDGDIDVVVRATNPGTEPVVGPNLNVIYRQHGTNDELLRDTRQFADLTIPPGESIELPKFSVPNMLSQADLVVESPQSRIEPNPKYQLYVCALCPNGTLTASIPAYFKTNPNSTLAQRLRRHTLRLSILAAFLVLMVVLSRPFCRAACPLGAIYALTTPLALARFKLNDVICIDCGLCDKSCPVELDVRKQINGPDCIGCGDCAKVCPKLGIQRTFGF